MNAYTNSRSLRHCASLAQASEYNLFILTDVQQINTSIEGRAAIGGNASFSSVRIGSKLCSPSLPTPLFGTDPTLVVGGNLKWDKGTNYSGNTVMTPNGHYHVTDVTYENANEHEQPIRRAGLNEDFDYAFEYFRCAARQWTNFTSLPNTTTVINCHGNVYMIGLNQDINVFRINANQVAPSGNMIGSGNNTLYGISSLTIIAPENSTILINVNGAAIDFGNYEITRNTLIPANLPLPCTDICHQLCQGVTPTEAQKKQILWNFYNASTIVTSNANFQGSVFAPFATIFTNGGSIEGTVIAEGYIPLAVAGNHTEVRNYLFSGCLPAIHCSPYYPTSSSTTTCSTTTHCTTSSSTTHCPTTSSTTHCPTSSSTTHCPTTTHTTHCPTTTYTHCPTTTHTHCPTTSSTTHCPTTSSTTHCPTTSSTTHCPTTSSTTHCPTTSSTTHCPTTSSTTHCPTTSSTTHCPTTSSTTHCPTTSSTTSSCTTSSSTTCSHTTWTHTTWTCTTPNTSSTTTSFCTPREVHYCPRCRRKTTTWRFNGRIHHYCFYCGYHYTD